MLHSRFLTCVLALVCFYLCIFRNIFCNLVFHSILCNLVVLSHYWNNKLTYLLAIVSLRRWYRCASAASNARRSGAVGERSWQQQQQRQHWRWWRWWGNWRRWTAVEETTSARGTWAESSRPLRKWRSGQYVASCRRCRRCFYTTPLLSVPALTLGYHLIPLRSTSGLENLEVLEVWWHFVYYVNPAVGQTIWMW